MKWSELPLRPTPRILRQFAATLLVVLALVCLRHPALIHGASAGRWVIGALVLLGIVGLLKPATIRWLFIGATVVTFPIGWAVTLLMLGLMFYLILTPVALVFRLLGRDELQLRRRPDQSSFWIKRGEPSEPERYLKQF